MIDSHCHLADEQFASDLDDVVVRARDAGVTTALAILDAASPAEAARADCVTAAWPAVRFALGVHPHQAGAFIDDPGGVVSVVREAYAARPGAVAIGEIGLDYHYDFAPRATQVEVFRRQIALAREVGRPVVIHTREADDDTIDALRGEGGGDVTGVFHCFTGDATFARRALDLGFHVSFSGIVTFRNADAIREAARMVPADRLLVETDSPYLAPVPFRGRRNEPARVARVVEAVAGTRGATVTDTIAQTSLAYHRLFDPAPAEAAGDDVGP